MAYLATGTSTNTSIGDIIDPQVLADQMSAKFPQSLVFANTPVVQTDTTFPMGSEGTTFTIPFWKRIGTFGALTEGTAMTPSKVSAATERAVVQRAGKAIEIFDTAVLVSMADPVSEVATQLARRAAEYIDDSLIVAMEKTPNTVDISAVSTGILDHLQITAALIAKLGDQHQKMLGVGRVIMHSKVYGDLLQNSAILNAYQSGFDTMKTGVVGTLMGLPVMLSDRVTVTTVSGSPRYNTYIAGPGSLGLFYQRAVKVEFDRDVLLQADAIVSTVHFASHLFGWDDVSNAQAAEDTKSIAAIKITSK